MKILQLFSKYVIVFILVSAICGLVYITAQQNLRQTANDPQIQIAEDSAVALKDIDTPQFGPDKIDLNNSLATFIAIYDKDGNPLEANATLDGELPKPPKGVFDAAKQNGENRVTWQPKQDVRLALVVVPVNNDSGQFVAVGRSLREVEKRENQLTMVTGAAWIIMLLFGLLGVYVIESKKTTEKNELTQTIQNHEEKH